MRDLERNVLEVVDSRPAYVYGIVHGRVIQ